MLLRLLANSEKLVLVEIFKMKCEIVRVAKI